MEEDAGKSIHDRYPGATAIDLNRAGVPLIEIVSEPDIRSAARGRRVSARAQADLEYLDVSDVSMEEGSLRVDANVSARQRGETKLGTKTEVKNMNSFSGVERALEVEFARQCELLERGGTVEQQTLLWDADAGEVRPAAEGRKPRLPVFPGARSSAADARRRSGSIASARELPELPGCAARSASRRSTAWRPTTSKSSPPIPRSPTTSSTSRARTGDAKGGRELGDGRSARRAQRDAAATSRSFAVRPADLAQLLNMVRDGLVSHCAAKQVFATMVETGEPPAQIAEREGLLR